MEIDRIKEIREYMNEDKSKLQLIGELIQADNKNLELIEEINKNQKEIDRLNNIINRVRGYIEKYEIIDQVDYDIKATLDYLGEVIDKGE